MNISASKISNEFQRVPVQIPYMSVHRPNISNCMPSDVHYEYSHIPVHCVSQSQGPTISNEFKHVPVRLAHTKPIIPRQFTTHLINSRIFQRIRNNPMRYLQKVQWSDLMNRQTLYLSEIFNLII